MNTTTTTEAPATFGPCEGAACTETMMGAPCATSRAARIIHAHLHEAFPA